MIQEKKYLWHFMSYLKKINSCAGYISKGFILLYYIFLALKFVVLLQLLASAVLHGVLPIVYEYEGTTLCGLLEHLAAVLQGRKARFENVFLRTETDYSFTSKSHQKSSRHYLGVLGFLLEVRVAAFSSFEVNLKESFLNFCPIMQKNERVDYILLLPCGLCVEKILT